MSKMGHKYCKMVLAPENKWLSEKLLGFSWGGGGDLRLGRVKAARRKRKGRGKVAEGSWCWKPSPTKRIFPKRFKVRGQGEEKGWRAPQPIRKPTRKSCPWPAVSGLSGQAAVFADNVDTLGLVIRMMKLGVRSSVPRPSKHISEPAQKLSLCCCVGPLLGTD